MKSTEYTRLCTELLDFNSKCRACPLAHSDQDKDPAIPGACMGELKDLKLVLISDHPGYYEVKNKYPMYDNQQDTDKKKRKRNPNAGSFIRTVLESWGLNSYRDVYITNAVKCNPGANSIIESHVKLCKRTWLDLELALIDKANKTVPILCLGRHAFTALKLLVPQLRDYNLNDTRRDVWYYRAHPIVFSFNPASVATSVARIETKDPKVSTLDFSLKLPLLEVSPQTVYLKDLEYIRKFIKIEGESMLNSCQN